MKSWGMLLIGVHILAALALAQSITIDGNFDDWDNLPVHVTDPANDEHDTDWWGDGLEAPVPRKYSDVDILEVKFAHDQENLYGYCKATGIIGRTARAADGHKAGRYYFIITIDVDNNDTTGYALQEGNYWPNSTGYDMNMEVEFYDGAFNTGHYINHEFLTAPELTLGRQDLENRIIRLRPGTYEHYLQYVIFPDTSFVYVSDKGEPVHGGIIEVAVSEDGHEAEMKAPMWGFFWDEEGNPIVALGDTIDISFSLEGSGELSETAIEAGYNGTKSVWGSDTAEPITSYFLEDRWTHVARAQTQSRGFKLEQNFPNPFNGSTRIHYTLESRAHVSIMVSNILGEEVSILQNESRLPGNHSLRWDGTNSAGDAVSSGIYFLTLIVENETGRFSESRRMLLLY